MGQMFRQRSRSVMMITGMTVTVESSTFQQLAVDESIHQRAPAATRSSMSGQRGLDMYMPGTAWSSGNNEPSEDEIR